LDQPHPERTRLILKAHPQVRDLIGRNSWTAAVLALVVSLQVALAWLFGKLGLHYWWVSLAAAWCVGAFANHSLYVIIHEATHNLIFKRRSWNRWSAILADLPNVFPGATGFQVYHLKHHSHQGDYHLDADIASRWEARLIGNSVLGKILWELLFPFFQLTRPPRLQSIKMWSWWSTANVAAALLFDAAILFLCGPNGLLYLLGSFFFAIGLHPLGARWVQEHYTLDPQQETFSYYGPLNFLALNVGYHNEHHDFPSIPWNRLPKLKALAPEFYDNLKYHRSWTRLWLQFLFDPRFTLFRRVERVGAGKVAQ
jgi:sphingolipid delta-4 desaturase